MVGWFWWLLVGVVCGGSGWVKSRVRRGLALWGIVLKGVVGVALEYVARGMLVVVAGEVSVYMVEVGVLRCWLSLWACCWCPCRRGL